MLGFGKCIMTLWLGLRLLFCFLLVSPVFYFSLSCFLLHYLNFFKFLFNLPSSSLVMVLCIISWLLPWPRFTACLEHCSTTRQSRTCRSVDPSLRFMWWPSCIFHLCALQTQDTFWFFPLNAYFHFLAGRGSHAACRALVIRSGTELVLPPQAVWDRNRWAAREVPKYIL